MSPLPRPGRRPPPQAEPAPPPPEPEARRRLWPRDEEVHYGEANRRRASQFAAERAANGRRGRRRPAPPRSDYEPEAASVELAVHQDVFGLAVESPGVTQQPLAPWITGEHQAIDMHGPAPAEDPPADDATGYRDPPPGRSVFPPPAAAPPTATPPPDTPYAEPTAYTPPPTATPPPDTPYAEPTAYTPPPTATPPPHTPYAPPPATEPPRPGYAAPPQPGAPYAPPPATEPPAAAPQPGAPYAPPPATEPPPGYAGPPDADAPGGAEPPYAGPHGFTAPTPGPGDAPPAGTPSVSPPDAATSHAGRNGFGPPPPHPTQHAAAPPDPTQHAAAPPYPTQHAAAPRHPTQHAAAPPGTAPLDPTQDATAPPGTAPPAGDPDPDRAYAEPRWAETMGAAWPPPAATPLAGPDAPTGEMPTVAPPAPAEPPSSARGSFLVAAGILLSRSAGLIREVVIGAFLGVGPAADAFKAALRIPNLMQNLLGEGVLSASFIPVYARLRGEGRDEEAGRLAGAIAGLLIALTGGISLLGVLFAEPLTRLLVPGYTGRTFDLTVQLTRVMFPGMGFLVLSAWCLGVLNSHRKFFLSYVAPVVWNVAQIAFLVVGVLVVGGYRTLDDKSSLAVALAWGVLVGGILQFAIQIGPVHRLLGHLRLSLDTGGEAVRNVLARFAPVLLGRGCIQIMGWVDLWLASYLVTGAVSSLTYTMVLYLLPVSLFGVSVAAAELPDLSQVEVHDPDTRRRFRLRLEDSMARIAWYVAPCATLFIVVGDIIVRAVFEHGSFSGADSVAVWLTLAFLSMGLLPITASRLLQNGLYALDDARTPARLGVVGVVLAAGFGLVLMFPLDRLFVGPHGIAGWDDILSFGPLPPLVRANPSDVPHLGIVGLAIGATLSDWIEYRLLSRALAWRIGRTHLAGRWLNQIALGCIATAAVAYVADLAFGGLPALVALVLVTGPAAAAYLAVTRRLRVPEAEATVVRLQALAARVRS